MLACRAACSQPPGIGPTLYEARGPGLYMLIRPTEGRRGARARARLERERGRERERGVRVEGPQSENLEASQLIGMERVQAQV